MVSAGILNSLCFSSNGDFIGYVAEQVIILGAVEAAMHSDESQTTLRKVAWRGN